MEWILKRNECVICKVGKLSNFLEYSMPCYSGSSANYSYSFYDMKFSKCLNCNSVQLSEILDKEIVYAENHNRQTVGNIWKKHYDEFCDFIGNVEGQNILEISDPSAKIAKKMTKYKHWFIVEPHSNCENNTDKISFIKEFFDEQFKYDEKFDLIVASHFFEHTYDPNIFLQKCNSLLEYGKSIFLSIPNVHHNLKSSHQPNSIIHFEHTFFYDNNTIEYLLRKNNFEIVKKYDYLNHSIFIEAKKTEVKNQINPQFEDWSVDFINCYKKYTNLIKKIESIDSQIILFGCNVYSQFLFQNGLTPEKISYIIDNDTSKSNNFLYGTKIKTFTPSENNLKDSSIIMISHMATYTDEIKKQLLSINPKINFI